MSRTMPHSHVLYTLGITALLATLTAGCSSGGSVAERSLHNSSAGRSGADSASTITVGYTNTESPGNSLPEWRYGGQAAIDYINAHGGINGAKIKPVFCYVDGSPEASISCANKFVDDHVALEFAGVDVGSDSSLPILQSAGIPLVGTVSGSESQLTSPDSFLLGGGNGPDAAALVQALKDSGAKKVDVVDFGGLGAGARALFLIIKQMAPRAGMQAAELQVPFSGANWTALVASALANKPDGFILDTREDDCTSILSALKTASYKGTSGAVSCSEYLRALGNSAPPTVAGVAAWTPDLRQYAPRIMHARLDVYAAAMNAAGHESLVNTPGASRTFSGWMELAEILRGIHGPVNAASVTKALQHASDVPGYLGPSLHCGQKVWPSEPSVCSAKELLLRIVPGPSGPRREPISHGFINLSNLAR